MKNRASAFSLVELLVVIAVLAIIAAIAVTNISNILAGVNKTRDQRNAQSLSDLVSSARGAGHPGWPTKADAISALASGIAVTNVADPSIVFHFRLDAISAEDQGRASAYLSSDGASLLYVPAGGQPTN